MPNQPAWTKLPDEELLEVRICDLGVKLEGSFVETQITRLYQHLEARGLRFRPACYLSTEWFSPTGVPAIAVPFYLAHPRLRRLELKQMLEVEGGTPEWCQQLLRHECGHALDHAYRISQTEEWRQVFGDHDQDYSPETYTPKPYSKSFVDFLGNWYAQSHPDEDFAETFAVWLSLRPQRWRKRYAGWNALKKLEYVDRLMAEIAQMKPLVSGGRKMTDARHLRKTLGRYYSERRKLSAEDFPDFYDADLTAIFAPEGDTQPAQRFLREHKKYLVASLRRWTGQRSYTINLLVTQFMGRCKELKLTVGDNPDRVLFELGAYLAALVTNHLHTGRFKRSV